MKTLIITAAPNSKSFNFWIAQSVEKWAIAKWNEVETINLYDEQYSQSFLKFEDISDVSEDKVRDLIQEKMKNADEYVFIFPVWWGSVPAILKNFFDVNLSAGFAFKYGKWWKIEKLLTWKTAKIYCTCDAPGFIYKIPFILWISIKSYLSKAILWFCGVKVTDFKLHSGTRKSTEEKRKAFLNSVENNA